MIDLDTLEHGALLEFHRKYERADRWTAREVLGLTTGWAASVRLLRILANYAFSRAQWMASEDATKKQIYALRCDTIFQHDLPRQLRWPNRLPMALPGPVMTKPRSQQRRPRKAAL